MLPAPFDSFRSVSLAQLPAFNGDPLDIAEELKPHCWTGLHVTGIRHQLTEVQNCICYFLALFPNTVHVCVGARWRMTPEAPNRARRR